MSGRLAPDSAGWRGYLRMAALYRLDWISAQALIAVTKALASSREPQVVPRDQLLRWMARDLEAVWLELEVFRDEREAWETGHPCLAAEAWEVALGRELLKTNDRLKPWREQLTGSLDPVEDSLNPVRALFGLWVGEGLAVHLGELGWRTAAWVEEMGPENRLAEPRMGSYRGVAEDLLMIATIVRQASAAEDFRRRPMLKLCVQMEQEGRRLAVAAARLLPQGPTVLADLEETR